ncbi:MAG: biopolymer transporter ExbD [Myxococcales bacterium]|nr:biopolymer transporter ExbD [Myxococcales bacterium]
MAGGGGPGTETSLDDPELVELGSFTEPNIVPLVDIMLVLLVILMASSTAIMNPGQGEGSGFRVNLPTASATDEISSITDELVVAVLSDGVVVARGEQVSMTELARIFAEEAKQSASRLVLVQADEQTYHKRVVEVMEAARKAGLHNLAIATKPEE